MSFKVEWIDSGREPRCTPNPAYPDGIDVDASFGASASCMKTLPYPAKRCGIYIVECEVCGVRIGITTAGRMDDPRSLKIACVRPEVIQ